MSHFRIVQHEVPGQHIREYAQATANHQEDTLKMSVNQYVPLSNPEPKPGDVTIIGAHANAFPKEIYEPLWDDLLARSEKQGWRIRSIWMADVAHQGQSSVINEDVLGNEPHWHDHSRDLMHLINLKRDEMPRPIVGIGHSMGGNQLAFLSLVHPRLFTSLVFLDPVIQELSAEIQVDPSKAAPPSLATLSTFRRNIWPSRQEAAASFAKSKFYQSWDRRVLDKWVEHGLREVPTRLQPDAKPPQVTLKSTPAQEVFTYLRPNYEGYGQDGQPINRRTHADVDPSRPRLYPFYRPEAPRIFERLPELRPSVLYIFGGTSNTSSSEANEAKVARTGIGVGGSGGVGEGRVKALTFERVGHLVPMEASEKTADAIAGWIGGVMNGVQEEMVWQQNWRAKTLSEKSDIDERWKKMVGGPPKKSKI